MENNIVENSEMVNSEIKSYESFDSMNLHEDILRGIYSYGFETPSIIQKTGIVPVIQGNDCIAQSQSGTGKTATFCIGNLQKIDIKIDYPQSLIIAPTRELANQIFNVITSLSSFTKVNIAKCVGGESVRESSDKINNKEKPAHIIVGTPGRICDFLRRKYINARHLKILTLDEADECLSRGFKDQVYDIFQKLPEDIQVALFSATMPAEMLELTKKFMRNPKMILVKNEQLTLEGIKQYYINCEEKRWKFETLCDIYELVSVAQCIIYCNTKYQLDWLEKSLIERNFTVSCIHGDMPTARRYEIMKNFRSGTTRILISTDLLSRGIDVQQVSLVINYDIPSQFESYIHRIGRSGRYGRKGVSINLCTKYDMNKIKEIEKFYDTQIEPLPQNFDKLI
jgi:translation initiation factor 4A